MDKSLEDSKALAPSPNENGVVVSSSLLEAIKFLDRAEVALRAGKPEHALFTLFVWCQRGDYILAGEETFEDQNFPELK